MYGSLNWTSASSPPSISGLMKPRPNFLQQVGFAARVDAVGEEDREGPALGVDPEGGASEARVAERARPEVFSMRAATTCGFKAMKASAQAFYLVESCR